MSKVNQMLMQQQENIIDRMLDGEIVPEQAISMLVAIGADREQAKAGVAEALQWDW